MVYIIILGSLVIFLLGLKLTNTVGQVSTATTNARQAWGIMNDHDINDETKEKLIKKSSIDMFASFLSILLRGLIALCAAFAIVYGAILSGICSRLELETALSNWSVIIMAIIAAPIIWKLIE